MMHLRVFATRYELMQATAARIAEALKQAISERGEGIAALSGGNTPAPAYAELASMPLDWPHITFLQVDERFAPASEDDSNEAMLRRVLAPALAAGARLLPMSSESANLGESAARANALYEDKAIDVALMGMGADGHTGSWFPQSPGLSVALNSPGMVVAISAPGASGSSQRLTLTRAALKRAGAIVLLITGAEKRSLLEDRMRRPLPVDELSKLPTPLETFWAP